MSVALSVTIEPRWSYSEAGVIFGVDRRDISALARAHGLTRPGRKPLDEHAMIRLGELLRVEVNFARAS